jgi:polynucleotide 5'-hydroxyl-kinase GRC3/NOL9
MIIGASDTGKSTLARYLFQELARWGVWVAYLDGDMGQSTLGLPTTMTLALSSGPGDDRFPPQGQRCTFFVGATTPRGHMLPTVVGAQRLQQKAQAWGAGVVVVDTTGLVDRNQGGKALKEWKIELLGPSLVIGLQRGRELEPILWPLRRDGRVRPLDLPVCGQATERGREARIARRRERLAAYLAQARLQQLHLRELAVYGLERLAPGSLLGLQDREGWALGLGVVQEVDRLAWTWVVATPLASLEPVASVRVGVAGWDLKNRREL